VNDQHEMQESDAARSAITAAARTGIKSSALGLVIGGAISLYLGMTFAAGPLWATTPEEAEWWTAVDNALFWCLRAVGVLFLIAAALAAAGQRSSMLLATLVEGVFIALMVVMSIVWTVEARIAGGWNIQVILLLILAALAVSGARRSWELYRAAQPRDEVQPPAP